ncbi:MAG: DUF309 domain-containing protein [Bryobacteraceae bacterium]|nr:DUF309 domain-containing protein [Bryobacteraceae bacterium]
MHSGLERGVLLFNEGAYFEAHEVLEEVWTPERGVRRLFLQSLIHFAVGLYHYERGNSIGAELQLRKALRKLRPHLPAFEGVDTARLLEEGEGWLQTVLQGRPIEGRPEMRLVQSVSP